MNEPPQIPPMTNSRPAIRYQLTRRDLFANWMTVIFRNRILQVFVLAALALNEFLILAPDFGARAFSQSIFYAVAYLIGFLGFLAVTQCVLALANAFLLKHRGVLGEECPVEQSGRSDGGQHGAPHATDSIVRLHGFPVSFAVP